MTQIISLSNFWWFSRDFIKLWIVLRLLRWWCEISRTFLYHFMRRMRKWKFNFSLQNTFLIVKKLSWSIPILVLISGNESICQSIGQPKYLVWFVHSSCSLLTLINCQLSCQNCYVFLEHNFQHFRWNSIWSSVLMMFYYGKLHIRFNVSSPLSFINVYSGVSLTALNICSIYFPKHLVFVPGRRVISCRRLQAYP